MPGKKNLSLGAVEVGNDIEKMGPTLIEREFALRWIKPISGAAQKKVAVQRALQSELFNRRQQLLELCEICLLYTSDAADE